MKRKTWLAGLFSLAAFGALAVPPSATLKVVSSWTLPNTDTGIRQAVRDARDLGFNAYAWCSIHHSAVLADACRTQGMFSIRVIEPLRKRKEARLQVVEPGEETWPGFVPVDTNSLYQYSGEPVAGHREMSGQPLVCPRDEGVIDYVASEVRKASAYLPDIQYGRRVKVDYCAMTVSWFFQPHWPLEKVAARTRLCVQGPYVEPGVVGMPMLGYYNSGPMARHRRSAERIAQELKIVADQGSRAVMICELGDILRDPAVCEAVRNGLRALPPFLPEASSLDARTGSR
jgi:hypothetical protein